MRMAAENLIDAALGRMASKQALDAQDVCPRRLEREPLAEQLRHTVGAERPARIGFDIRTVSRPVEDEVGTVVNERGVGGVGRPREGLDGEGVAAQRGRCGILRALDVVVRGAVEHDVRPTRRHRLEHGHRIGQIELRSRERGDVARRRQPRDERRTELTAGTGDHRARHAQPLAVIRA